MSRSATSSPTSPPSRGPLEGVTVIELAGIGPGPFAAMKLADLGAEVISVERALPSGPGGRVADSGLLRRGRRSIVLDLKHPDAVEIVLRLVTRADALVEGFRPGVAERLGVGPEPCLERNTRLAYGRITGWGQDGPRALEAGHDINYLAISGMLSQIGSEARPEVPLNLVADFGGGGMLMAFGLVCGILQARSSGRGQVVDAAMLDGVLGLSTILWGLRNDGQWQDGRRQNYFDGGAPFYDVYRCRDDRWVAVGPMEPQFLATVLERLGVELGEPLDHLDRSTWPRLRSELSRALSEHSRDEVIGLLADVDTCVTAVLELSEVPGDPQVAARQALIKTEDGFQPAPSPRFSHTPAAVPVPPPERGSDTEPILEELGYTRPEIARLQANRAIRTGPRAA